MQGMDVSKAQHHHQYTCLIIHFGNASLTCALVRNCGPCPHAYCEMPPQKNDLFSNLKIGERCLCTVSGKVFTGEKCPDFMEKWQFL